MTTAIPTTRVEFDETLDRHNRWSTRITDCDDIDSLVRILQKSLQLAKHDGEILRVSVQQIDEDD